MHASIIIPTNNRAEFLADTIKSIQSLEDLERNIEILVIDNASTDNTGEIVEEFQAISQYPLRYFREEKIGLHFSRHTGAIKARGEILIFIDDDVFLNPGWLSAVLNAYNDPNVWAVGGPVHPHWEVDPPDWIHKVPKDYLSLLDYGCKSRPIGKDEGINGCNYSIKRNRLFDVGGFHPDSYSDPSMLWHRGDGEAGLTRKILAANGIVMYEAGAAIKHRISQERLSKEYILRRGIKHGIENAYSFMRRWNCSIWAIVVMIIGGWVCSVFQKIRNHLSFITRENGFHYEIASSRFQAIAKYGRLILSDSNLRDHVMRETYLE
ncbi:MAG: glycosyltransferase [Candidatus Thorarchaeota archaeon]|jgi:glycosyltransferase involved in cell wall biosynthesis